MSKKDISYGMCGPLEAYDTLRKCVLKYGIHVYNDPVFSGSGDCGFIVSPRKLSKKEIREASKLQYPTCYEK